MSPRHLSFLVPFLMASASIVALHPADGLEHNASWECHEPAAHEGHEPIVIVGDAMLFAPDPVARGNGVRSGMGTAEDPFVISEWWIEGDRHAIQIRDTTAHIIIRDVVLAGAAVGGTDESALAPLSVSNAEHVRVENVTILGNKMWGAMFENVPDLHVNGMQFGYADGADTPDAGIGLGATAAVLEHVQTCGDGDLMWGHRIDDEAGPLVARDFRTKTPVRVVFGHPPSATIERFHGPIAVHANMREASIFEIRDSTIHRLSVASDGIRNRALVENVSVQPFDTTGHGIFVTMGTIIVHKLDHDASNPDAAAFRGGSIKITNSSFVNDVVQQQVVYLSDIYSHTQYTEQTKVEHVDLGDGPFEFSGNDVAAPVLSGNQQLVRFETRDGDVLVGANNFLSQDRVVGNIELTSPRDEPMRPERFPSREAAAASLVSMVGVFLGVLLTIGALRGREVPSIRRSAPEASLSTGPHRNP